MTAQLLTPPAERSIAPADPAFESVAGAAGLPSGIAAAGEDRARRVPRRLAVGGNLLVYSSLDHKTEVLQVVHDIPAGEIVSADDLRVVAVDVDPTVPTVAPDDIGAVVNQYARVHIAAGTLMVDVLVQPTPLVALGQGVVAVEIRPTHLPAGLRERSRVMLVVVNRDGSPGLVTEGRVVSRRRRLRGERERAGAVGRGAPGGCRRTCRRGRRACGVARSGRRPCARERCVMAIVAVVGDACTTTTVALASAWPASSEALIVEADPDGRRPRGVVRHPGPALAVDGRDEHVRRAVGRRSTATPVSPRPVCGSSPLRRACREHGTRSPNRHGRWRRRWPRCASPIAIVDAGDVPQPPVAHPLVASAAVVGASSIASGRSRRAPRRCDCSGLPTRSMRCRPAPRASSSP